MDTEDKKFNRLEEIAQNPDSTLAVLEEVAKATAAMPYSSYGQRNMVLEKVNKNESLVKFISDDWRRRNISDDDISQIWYNALENGAPCHNLEGGRNVYGISPQVHHNKALKDGGKNINSNFRIVVSIVGKDSKMGDTVIQEEMGINSHKPLHEYDNPLVELWQDKNGFVSDKKSAGSQRIKVLTQIRATNCHAGEYVLYYGGPRPESCCIGTVDGKVRQAEFTPGIGKPNEMQNQL